MLRLDGDVQANSYQKDGTTAVMQVQANTDGAVTLPLFGYDGYRAELNGGEVAWTLGENNRLRVPLEKGMQGELRVWFAGKHVWRAAEAVSLCALLWLALAGAKRLRAAVKAK